MLFCADPVVWARDAQYHCGTKKAEVWGQSMPIRIQLDPTNKANNYKAWLLLLSLCHHIHVFRRQVLVTYCWYDCNGGRYCRERPVRIKVALQRILRNIEQRWHDTNCPKDLQFQREHNLEALLLHVSGSWRESVVAKLSTSRESKARRPWGKKKKIEKKKKLSNHNIVIVL